MDIGAQVQVTGILLGGRFDNLAIVDSVESFESGTALPIIDDDLIERIVEQGIFPIGGGRFGYCYQCMIRAELGSSARGFAFSLKKVKFLQVTYNGSGRVVVQQ
jgi:hypothetical protein